MQVQEAVTVSTQVAAVRAQNDGGGLSIVVVVARWARLAMGAIGAADPLARGKTVNMIVVENTERGQGKPQLAKKHEHSLKSVVYRLWIVFYLHHASLNLKNFSRIKGNNPSVTKVFHITVYLARDIMILTFVNSSERIG